jgi:phosphoadenosine phosphosulfate reductase
MSDLIRIANKRVAIEPDGWLLLTEPGADVWPEGDVIVPLADWLARSETLASRQGRIGVWLAPADDTLTLKDRLDGLSVIAIQFPKFTDGRGYSHATLLRKRLGWTGELRAIGEVLRDQLFYMARTGFDAFAVPAGFAPDALVGGLSDFSVAYQDAVVDPAAPALANRTVAVREARIARTAQQLKKIAARHSDAVFATSLSAEDMVITDLIARHSLPIHIVTLDTGRLHAETLGMIGEVKTKYGIDIEVMHPVAAAVDAHVAAHGAYAFYESLELRKECCGIRKVEPLNRALAGRSAWLTGQRRDQALTRTALPEVEQDEARGMAKYNPLADWSWDDVLAYAARFDVPLNPLHARGYPSIGCEPCTRAIRPGEDSRAGRWWWEQADKKECGLHVGPEASASSSLESAA